MLLQVCDRRRCPSAIRGPSMPSSHGSEPRSVRSPVLPSIPIGCGFRRPHINHRTQSKGLINWALYSGRRSSRCVWGGRDLLQQRKSTEDQQMVFPGSLEVLSWSNMNTEEFFKESRILNTCWNRDDLDEIFVTGCIVSCHFYPRPQSAPTGIVVVHCVRPSVRPSVHPEGRYRSNPLRILAISLKSGGMMHSTMKRIAT